MRKEFGINMGVIKQKNRAAILNILRENGSMPRKDISKLLQLTPAAVTIIVNEMIEEGVIKEKGELEEDDRRAGRKKILVDIDYDIKYVLGISIESELCSIGIANIRGVVINSMSTPINKELTPEDTLKNIANECIGLLWREGILKENVLGVGVGIVGPVDEKNGISKHAYGLWKHEVHVKQILEKELDTKVVVDNNVRALAIAEIDHGKLQNINNMLFIKYGPGIGSAIVINRELYTGSNNVAGEIGHTVVEFNGITCRCGKLGCLETVASSEAVRKKIRKVFSEESAPMLYSLCKGDAGNLNTGNIIRSAEKGDLEVQNIINNVADYMALAVSNAMSIFDPQRLVLYGEMFKHKIFMDRFKEQIKKNFEGSDLNALVCLSVLKSEQIYIGGIALAIREFFYKTGAMY